MVAFIPLSGNCPGVVDLQYLGVRHVLTDRQWQDFFFLEDLDLIW